MEKKNVVILAVLVLLAVIIAGGFWIWQGKKQDKNSVKQEIFNSEESPEKVVENFYNWYIARRIEMIDNKEGDPKKIFSEETSLQCLTEDLRMQSADFIGHSDPILCAQEFPTCTKSELKNSKNGEAVILSHQYFSGQRCQMKQEWDSQTEIKLKLINDQWKINEITCLKREE